MISARAIRLDDGSLWVAQDITIPAPETGPPIPPPRVVEVIIEGPERIVEVSVERPPSLIYSLIFVLVGVAVGVPVGFWIFRSRRAR